MNKMLVIIPAVSAIAIGVFGILNINSKAKATNDKITTVQVSPSYMSFSSIESLEAASDIILVGRSQKDFENRDHKSTRYSDGSLQDFYTLTHVKVDKVIKGDPSLKNINIVEPIGIVTENNKKYLMKYHEYDALEKNKEYLLYLRDNGMGNYGIINMNNGRFEIERLKNNGNNVEIAEDSTTRSLIKEIKARYKF